MNAIYWLEESNSIRRLDSEMVVPMHNAGYTIIKMWMDDKLTEERLEPNDEIPEGFVQESRYGYVIFNQESE